jgi:murein DD-endopeptidase MepM/ murein hydrolase activator NlpD
LVLSVSASACEALDAKVDEHQLMRQQPILGREIRGYIAYESRRQGNRIKMRPGITYEAAAGTPVVAVHGGRVRFAQTDGQYGNVIILEHGSGLETLYAFLDGFDVRVGDCVAAGAILARIGSATAGRKPALYFEVSDDGQFVYAIHRAVQIPMKE